MNASSVRVSWSNNPCVPTSLTYTSHFTATGSAVSGRELVLPPQQTSAAVSVSERPGHLHNFTIHYILSEGMMATAVSEIFSFGKKSTFTKACSNCVYFVYYTDVTYFQIQFGPIDYCLNWNVRHLFS